MDFQNIKNFNKSRINIGVNSTHGFQNSFNLNKKPVNGTGKVEK